jgi:hypothetical protein
MGRGIAVHLSIDKGGAIGADRREPAPGRPFKCDTARPNRLQGLAALPAHIYVVGQPHGARIRQGATMQVGISHAMLSVLVTHRAGSDLLPDVLDVDHGRDGADLGVLGAL